MTFVIYTQPHCPRCPELKRFAETLTMAGRYVNAIENMEECVEHSVVSTPTIIFYEDDSVEKGRAYDIPGVKRLLGLT